MRDFDRIMYSNEVRDLRDEVDRLIDDLDRTAGGLPRPPGHCTPSLDVLDCDDCLEVIVDLPGVPPDRVRVMLKNDYLLVVGEKCSPYVGEQREASFHLVERGFGRFARAVKLDGAFDGGRTRAVARSGELRVTVPRIGERRGQEFMIPVADS